MLGVSLPEVINKRANRQYVPIPDDELWRFVDSKDKVYVAFTMENGYPHVSPVWFCTINRKFYLRTHDYKVKTRLAERGKACCTIDEGNKYAELRGVVIWGHSRVVTDNGLIREIEKAMNAKYRIQQWKAAEMPGWWVQDRKTERRAYVEIMPERVSSWDNTRVVNHRLSHPNGLPKPASRPPQVAV